MYRPTIINYIENYSCSSLSEDIRLLFTLPDDIIETFLSGRSGDYTNHLLPYFDNLTLFRSYLSFLILKFRLKRSFLNSSVDSALSIEFLSNGYISINNFLPEDVYTSLSSILSQFLLNIDDSTLTWDHQISSVCLVCLHLILVLPFLIFIPAELSFLSNMVSHLVSPSLQYMLAVCWWQTC